MKEAGFELRKWATNNPELSAMIKSCENENSQCELVTEINVDDDSYTKACFGSDDQFKKVLGLCWHPETDTIVFDFCNFVEGALKLEPSKRNILKVVSILFDPLGLLCPIIIQMKVIFQKLCVDEKDWDNLAPQPIIVQWNQFLHELFEL